MKRSLSYKKHKQNKQQRKTTKKNKNKKYGRHMKGGDFSQEEKDQLLNIGFTNDQLVHLEGIASKNEIQNRYDSLNGNITQADIAELVTCRLLNMGDWQNISSIPNISGDDNDTIAINDISFSSDDTHDTDDTDAITDNEDNTIGGKKRISKKSKKSKKSRKTKKTRKQKGGMCYGTGVGANYNNPNYSIHNTELLELFPYKPK